MSGRRNRLEIGRDRYFRTRDELRDRKGYIFLGMVNKIL